MYLTIFKMEFLFDNLHRFFQAHSAGGTGGTLVSATPEEFAGQLIYIIMFLRTQRESYLQLATVGTRFLTYQDTTVDILQFHHLVDEAGQLVAFHTSVAHILVGVPLRRQRT